jgi:hypothetical protein
MFLDLLLRHRRTSRTATFSRPQQAHDDDFRDTVPSMFWLDSEPPAVDTLEVTRPLVRQPATIAQC